MAEQVGRQQAMLTTKKKHLDTERAALCPQMITQHLHMTQCLIPQRIIPGSSNFALRNAASLRC